MVNAVILDTCFFQHQALPWLTFRFPEVVNAVILDTCFFQLQALPWLTFRFPKCFPPIFYCVVTQYFLCVAMGRLTPGKRDIQI